MEELIKNNKSLMISSLNKEGLPQISYTPFIMDGKDIYVYLSKAAEHYYNLSENSKCSVMIIEDESVAQNIFARGRVSFNCEAIMLEEVREEIFEKFGQRHSEKMLSMFRKMDFDMFKLSIKNGRLVKGFGQAFDVNLDGDNIELKQVMGIGHK